MIPVANASGTPGTPISANGNYCTITAPMPALNAQGSGAFGCQVIDVASYVFTTGAGVSAGTVTLQALARDGATWFNLTVAGNPFTLAANATVSGTINGPWHGVRMVVAALAGGSITYAEIIGSIRTL